MASKVYTAQEMREESTKVTRYDFYVASDMLRQAADALEREAKREKKYQYAVKRNGNATPSYALAEDEARMAVKELNEGGVAVSLVRREVGEWEEVRNEI